MVKKADNYIIIGEDDYIRAREIDRIKKAHLTVGTSELNFSEFTAPLTDGLIDALSTVPFISDKRVVLLLEAEKLTVDRMGEITRYMANPAPGAVFVISGRSSVERIPGYKEIAGSSAVIKADKPTPAELKVRIRSFFAKEKVKITEDALDLIVRLKGDDTTGIRTDIEKLLVFSGGEEIKVEAVEELVGSSVLDSVFSLADSINGKDPKKVFGIMDNLEGQKKQPVEIIGYLGWYIKLIKNVKCLSLLGMDADAIARELKRSPWEIKKRYSQAKAFSVKKIKKWEAALFAADQDIKTGFKQPALAMDTLIAELLR
ncbi:MAG: DNA polymerase III subunit delta [Candidatus Omnitrophica bacterium]|nr:DNA polymerase III subunit delta [Candidatus Omnitrophota bacterium]